jgi:uncharacterized lipoprotein NlpE involved in copper resistance
MKKSISILTAALVVFGLSACQTTSKEEGQAIDAAHNSRNSVNWEGVYTGTIPAADGPGINVRITLNLDETYEIWYQYIDRPEEFTEKGVFTWDESGGNITLDIRDWPPYYKVGENILFQLDMEGNVITGSLADDYILHKIADK